MRTGVASLAALQIVTMVASAGAQAPATRAPIAEALTSNHRFRVVVMSAPQPLPLQRHFNLQLAVYEGRPPGKRVTHAKLDVTAGMTHGMGELVHGMQSTPVIQEHKGRYEVRGMMFHMVGTWTVRVRVSKGGHVGTADLTLECCGDE
jgi:hypothetical protein